MIKIITAFSIAIGTTLFILGVIKLTFGVLSPKYLGLAYVVNYNTASIVNIVIGAVYKTNNQLEFKSLCVTPYNLAQDYKGYRNIIKNTPHITYYYKQLNKKGKNK
mgnify:FL=1